MSPRKRLRSRYETEDVTTAATPVPETPVPAEPQPQAQATPDVPSAQQAEARIEFPEWMHPERARGEPPPEPAPIEAAAATPEEAVAPKKGARAFFLMIGLALVAFATGLLLFNNLVMPRLIHGIGGKEVPDLRNLTLEQAEQALRATEMQISRAGERFDPEVPRGFILDQDPGPGTPVRGKKRISVIVSLGEEFSSVPELFGESQRSAEQLLRSAGLKMGEITRAPSDEVGEGLVAGSDPGPESVLPHGGTVNLLVSTGSGEDSMVMPDLLGREVGAVRRQLEALGFHLRVQGGTTGTVVAQRPPAGSRITRATEIALQATGRMIR
jgi:beta-lactam-binding protein with PASTA domain